MQKNGHLNDKKCHRVLPLGHSPVSLLTATNSIPTNERPSLLREKQKSKGSEGKELVYDVAFSNEL